MGAQKALDEVKAVQHRLAGIKRALGQASAH
jgi:hypothetical protein